MAIGVLNLWDITDELMQLLESHKGGATFTVTDKSPDEIRSQSDDTYLSLYLFHVSPDKFHRNALPVTSPPAPTSERTTRAFQNPHQPLSLNLHYLVTAYSKGVHASRNEQQAMTAALKCFHEQSIVTATIPGDNHPVEFTLTLEPETADEIGRLWQAITTPLRLAAIYKVSVVLIEPPSSPPTLNKKPDIINLTVSPAALPFANAGQVSSTYIRINYIAPGNKPQNYDLIPAVVPSIPEQSFTLYGAGLNKSSSDHLYLLFPDDTEQDVTSWVSTANESQLLLKLPETGIPPAGVYQLRVGNSVAIGESGAIRSNATPFSIAAWVDPTGGPVLNADNSTYTLNGQGFIPGAVQVFLETIPLTPSNVSNSALDFQLPGNLPKGVYGVRVRVNQVESPPAKWVVIS